MAAAVDTAAKVCKALQDEHEKRAKYFKQGKVQKYALRDTVWVERHHKDVLFRHGQASWYVPGVIVRRVRQDVYAVRVGDNKILDHDHTQLRPRAPDPSGRPVTFEFTAGNVDSDEEGEDDDFTAGGIRTDISPPPGPPPSTRQTAPTRRPNTQAYTPPSRMPSTDTQQHARPAPSTTTTPSPASAPPLPECLMPPTTARSQASSRTA